MNSNHINNSKVEERKDKIAHNTSTKQMINFTKKGENGNLQQIDHN